MRLALIAGAAISALVMGASHAAAQGEDYPSRPIKIIIAYPPGGIADIAGRIVANKMAGDLGQAIVVENRAGGSANPGTRSVAVAPPDGYTLLFGNVATHAINIHLYGDQHYHPIRDFTPIGRVGESSLVLVASPKAPFSTVPELIAYAKANPGKLNFGSAGPGSISHMGLELLKSLAGIDITHVPYRGTNAVVPDLLSGQLDGYFDAPGSAIANIEAKKLKGVGFGGPRRSPLLPEMPTVGETVSGFEIATWFALYGPAGLPQPVTAKLGEGLKAALADPDVKRRYGQQFLDVTPSTPAELTAFMQSEIEKFGKLTRAVGMAK